MAETPDPIDVEWTYWKHRSDGWSVAVVDDSGVVCIVPAASRDDLDALNTASRIADLLTRPIVDDATRQEVEDMVLGALPSRCPATLGKRPTWVGVDQYDPCSCRLPNGHDGDHECSHGTESNNHPGEPKRLSPTVKGRPAELLADAYLGRTDK